MVNDLSHKPNLDVNLQANHSGNFLLHNLKTSGCAVLINHDIPVQLLNDIFEQWGNFFSSKDKIKWLRTNETDEGFIPINVETAQKGDTLADFKELYQTHYNGQYPTNINTESTIKLFDALVKLGEKLIGLLDSTFPTSVKNKMCTPLTEMIAGSNNHLIRIIHYPPIAKGVTVPRAAPHTDICLFTIVFGATFHGLELQDQTGNWYEPQVNDLSLVIFNSEMLEIATNGYLKAVVHRVKADPNSYTTSRYSLPLGFHPLRQAQLKKNITAIDHLRNRLNEMGYDGNLLNIKDH